MIFRVDLKILFLIVALYFTKQLKIYLITMIFIIMHEISHLIMGITLKMKISALNIMPFGLSVEFNQSNNNSEIKKILVAIAGPLFNILIIIITFFLKADIETKQLVLYSNLSLAIFNLLPIFPLDGGRILKILLSMNLSKKEANIQMSRITNITMFIITFIFSIFIYYYKNICFVFIILYLWYIVLKEN